MDQLDIPHLDQFNQRVYWVYIADPVFNRDYPQLPKEGIELCPYFGVDKHWNPDKLPFPEDKEKWRIGNWLCDKPYFKMEGVFVRLTSDLREWLEAHDYSYVVQYRWTLMRLGWYVGLHDTKSAAHFKLVHGK